MKYMNLHIQDTQRPPVGFTKNFIKYLKKR